MAFCPRKGHRSLRKLDFLSHLPKHGTLQVSRKGTLRYKNYTGSVEYSEQDDCLYGKVLGISRQYITYEGSDIRELKQDFQNAVDDYLALCAEKNIKPDKPYKGNFNVRVGPEKHSRIALQSIQEGISINAYVNNALDFYQASGH